MSTSASPSATPSAECAEHLSNLIAIPSLFHEHQYFLGPIGNLDPTEFISAETNIIPFRLAKPNLGPPLGSIENIELARFRSKNFNRWWGEWKQHIFHQSASMYMTDLFLDVILQTTESSPPRKSNSSKDIEYALGLIPNGGGLASPVIGHHALKTSSLLQGQIREPADVSRKRKTKASAIDPSALAPKKKAEKKSKPTDDLPALDPSIEQALDEEEIEEDVDHAVAELSDPEKTPSASPKQTPPTPAAPAHFSRKKKTAVKKKSAPMASKPAPSPSPPPSPPVPPETSNRSPLAAGSHNVEEEEQPAAPAILVLADLFSFDIKDYLEETEEDTTSKALAPLSGDVKKTLEDISHQLEASSLDSLVPFILSNTNSSWKRPKQRLAERRERKDIEATIQVNRQLVHEEKSKLDQLSEGPIKSNIDQLEARKIELLAQLQECKAELHMGQEKLANLPKAIEEQKSRLKLAIRNVADMTKSLKVIPGTNAQDTQAIEEVEQIRQRAVSAIQRYMSQ
uniref:Aminotransferase-like protein n=1 Tax=Oryza meridionalis TaxID=40149 RepID=A0A0E0C1I0_9ORYZ